MIKEIKAYLAKLPADQRAALERLHAMIQEAAPQATERITYQVPAFYHQGMLVAYAGFKKHCGFYIMSPETTEAFKAEIAKYDTAKATIRFKPDKPLPKTLIIKIVKARIRENERNAKS